MQNDELVQAIKALEYYAEIRNYNPVGGGTDIPILSDKGNRARWALEAIAKAYSTNPSDEKSFSQIALERAGYEIIQRMPDAWSLIVRKAGKDLAHYWPKKQWWNLVGQAAQPDKPNNGRGLQALIDRLQAVAP